MFIVNKNLVLIFSYINVGVNDMYRVYQIQSNDTLQSIATMLNIDVDILKRLNGIKNDVNLIPGSFLIIPVTDDRFTKYIVKKGDTIYSIATTYDVDPNLVLRINGLNKEDYIYPNQEIIIPSKNYKFYMTEDGDTIESVLNKLQIDYNNLLSNNDEIFLTDNQLIIYK